MSGYAVRVSLRGRWRAAALVILAAVVVVALRQPLGSFEESLRLNADGGVRTFLRWSVFACFVYVVVVFGLYGVLALFAGVDATVRNRQRRAEDFDALESSRFTIPVSVVAAVYNEAPVVVACTRTLLAQDYPEHEVIVVDDGSTDETFARLYDAFDLEPREVFYRRIIDTRPLAGVYRSRLDSRLTVVRKLNGGKADALNCGINFARYRYVAGVDGDTLYRPQALLSGMRLAVRDPARVIGVTSHVAISFRPRRCTARSPAAAPSTGACSATSSTSTTCARSSTTGSRGADCASCFAPSAPSRSGAATCSRRWTASRASSPARTSS